MYNVLPLKFGKFFFQKPTRSPLMVTRSSIRWLGRQSSGPSRHSRSHQAIFLVVVISNLVAGAVVLTTGVAIRSLETPFWRLSWEPPFWQFGTSGFGDWATSFGNLLENFYISHKNIWKCFTCKIFYFKKKWSKGSLNVLELCVVFFFF